MPLFRFGLKCSVCGKLNTKFTLKVFAVTSATGHLESWEKLGEDDHKVEVIDFEKEKK